MNIPCTPERDRAITIRARVIIALAAAGFLMALLPSITSTMDALAAVLGVR
jgi:hypothetical protein